MKDIIRAYITIIKLRFLIRRINWQIARQNAANDLLRREIQERREYLAKLEAAQ